jgi:hypothetical protein
MLINDLKPTSGEIIINGKNINKLVGISVLNDKEKFILLFRNEILKLAFVHNLIGL